MAETMGMVIGTLVAVVVSVVAIAALVGPPIDPEAFKRGLRKAQRAMNSKPAH
jgi:hypothetical protein